MSSGFDKCFKESVRPKYVLINLGIRHVKWKTKKNTKNTRATRVHHKTTKEKFFKVLVTQNSNSFRHYFFLVIYKSKTEHINKTWVQ